MKPDKKAPSSERESEQERCQLFSSFLTIGLMAYFRERVPKLFEEKFQTLSNVERFSLAAVPGYGPRQSRIGMLLKKQAEPWKTPFTLHCPSSSNGPFSDTPHSVGTDGPNLLPYFNTDNRP